MSIVNIVDAITATAVCLFIIALVLALWLGHKLTKEEGEAGAIYLLKNKPVFRWTVGCFILGVILMGIADYITSTDAYQAQLTPPTVQEQRISQLLIVGMGYVLSLIGVIVGIVGAYSFYKMFIIEGLPQALQWSRFDERAIKVVATVFGGIIFICLSLLMAISGVFLLVTGRAATFIVDQAEMQEAIEAEPREDYIRIVIEDTALLNTPELGGTQIGKLDSGDSVMLFYTVWRGTTPVNGYLPCMVNEGAERFKKGWILADHLRRLHEEEYSRFFLSFLRGNISINALKEIAISAVISSIICVAVYIFLGDSFEHYTETVIGLASAIAIVGKYYIFGAGVIPLFGIIEFVIIFAVDEFAAKTLEMLGLDDLKWKISKFKLFQSTIQRPEIPLQNLSSSVYECIICGRKILKFGDIELGHSDDCLLNPFKR